jgi:hypothetical protein
LQQNIVAELRPREQLVQLYNEIQNPFPYA